MFIVSTTSFSTLAAASVTPDADQKLRIACHALRADPKQESAKPCVYFIRGFLAATLNRDTVKVEVSGKKDNSYSYLRNLFEAGVARRANHLLAARSTRLCISFANYSVSQIEPLVIKRLIEPPSKPIDSVRMLGPRILNVLTTEFRCGQN